MDENRNIAVIVANTNDQEKRILLDWIDEIIAIHKSGDTRVRKIRKVAGTFRHTGKLASLLKRLKPALWENRSKNFKMTLGVAAVTAVLLPGQVGLAAAGFGIALPIWLVSAAGYSFLVNLSDALRKVNPPAKHDIIDAEYTVIEEKNSSQP